MEIESYKPVYLEPTLPRLKKRDVKHNPSIVRKRMNDLKQAMANDHKMMMSD